MGKMELGGDDDDDDADVSIDTTEACYACEG
jgi:hypothetical protein